MKCGPAGTPEMVYVPSAPVCDPIVVPSIRTCTPVSGEPLVASMTRPRTMLLPCARVIEGDTSKAIARNLRTRLSGMVPPNDFKWSRMRDRIVDHASPCETAFLFMPRSAPQSYFHLYTLSN